MSVTVPEFWSLAEKSRLLPPRTCAEVRHRWQALKGTERSASARTLAEWLVAEGELTRYQAKLLLAGQPGPFYFGEYLVCKRLHRGRLEDCFQAVHAPTTFPVTLRFVRGTAFEPTTDLEDVREIFEQAPRSEGPLVPFYEWVDCGAYQFGVFGRLEGRPVSELIAERGKLDAATACHVVREAAAALAALHAGERGHGAVRTETIWVDEEDRVAALPRQLCEPWDRLRGRKWWLTLGGDPAAISVAECTAPEAAGRSAAPSPAADVYSLGCVLYSLLVGRPPFTGANVAEILQQHSSEPLPPVSRRSVPEALRPVLERMLAKDPARRFADASLVASALAAIGPPPPSRGSQRLQPDTEDANRRTAYLTALGRRANGTSRGPLGDAPPPSQRPPAASPLAAAAAPLPIAKPISLDQGPAARPTMPAELPGPGPSPSLSARMARRRRVDWTAIGVSVLVAAAAAGGVVLWHVSDRDDAVLKTYLPDPQRASLPDSGLVGRGQDAPAREQPIADDGQTLWAAPTSGSPISVGFLPAGTQGLVYVRVADLVGHAQGEPILAAAGPQLTGLLAELRRATGFEPHEIAHVAVGLRAGEAVGGRNLSLVLRPTPMSSLSYADLRRRLARMAPDAADNLEEVHIEGRVALLRDDTAIYLAGAADTRELVLCPAKELEEILQRAGSPPPMQREVEQLLLATDVERHVTLLLSPRVLLGDGRDFLSRQAALLRHPAQWFVGERTQAVLLSAHWGEHFFLEMQAIAAADAPPWELRAGLEERLAELPALIEDHVLAADLQAYGRRVVGRLPEMVRRLVSYTRSAVEGGRAVLRCYLPAPAGHNLLMASEILLAEIYSGSGTAPGAPPEEKLKPVAERLEKVTSLSFTRDTLEAALDALATDVGVPIEIRGNDLQLEGITKNQSFAIDLRDRTAREILVEILRLANPDKTAASASDPRQKLIFTIERDAAGTETIYVTTRRGVEQRGVKLPPEFAPSPQERPPRP